ncbi:hypothetical protein DE146DRAFT_770547 [Phaeosphaeria sp. MPI-PUGE-AT-0046c]|nr:hypothetical protein DE146DRAFT_770547 [Phaeosphaeria sp. MPI-PUGE-AT-0046c]
MNTTKSLVASLPGFALLGPSIYEYIPTSIHRSPYTVDKFDGEPSLILLCTWTGAQNRYIAKYTSKYQSLFPTSRIMVIATTAKDLCFRNSRRKQYYLKPAVERISSLEYLSACGNDAGTLMHVFSEGGSNKACELAEAYFTITGRRLPVSALCFDSTPGHPRYLRLCNALNKSLPQIPVLKHTGLLLGSVVLGAIWITYVGIKGYENNVITRTRQRLLDPVHWNLSSPRCYLYSINDQLIAWKDVNEHAELSMRMGFPVTEVLFEQSGHVGHARQDPELYWNAVMATWHSTIMCDEKTNYAVMVGEMDSRRTTKGSNWSDFDSQCTLMQKKDAGGWN